MHRNVFDDFTWDRDGPEYSKWGDNLIPSRIPLSALISGMSSLLARHHTHAHSPP